MNTCDSNLRTLNLMLFSRLHEQRSDISLSARQVQATFGEEHLSYVTAE